MSSTMTQLLDEIRSCDFAGVTDAEKVLVGCRMISEALADIRRAIGPSDENMNAGANLMRVHVRTTEMLRTAMYGIADAITQRS